MTRYEKFKPGMAFLHGEEFVETLEDALETTYDFVDCLNCPVNKTCTDIDHCKDNLRAYLSEEVE